MCYIHYTVEVVGLGRQLVKHVQPSLEKEKEVLIRTTMWCGLEIVRTTMWCGLEIIRTTVTYLITAFSALLNCWNNSVIDALWDQYIEL